MTDEASRMILTCKHLQRCLVTKDNCEFKDECDKEAALRRDTMKARIKGGNT